MRGADDDGSKRARDLRQAQTEAEARLWARLRDRRLGGAKFVRQHPVGAYVADFACRDRRLIVELDGSQHADSAHDRRRDAWLVSQGWRILRFWNAEVFNNLDGVLQTIHAALSSPRGRGEAFAPSLGAKEARRARVRGWFRRSHTAQRPLTLGCRLASLTTRSTKPSPRKRGEENAHHTRRKHSHAKPAASASATTTTLNGGP